ncbi:glycosyltransferase [Acidobacteriota bacterium]
MSTLFIIFIGISTLLWLSVYGYFLILWVIANRKLYPDQEIKNFPDITAVIPTLNEEEFILSKLEDLKSTDYPADCMNILVVDGGSTDKTPELVEREIESGEKVQLLRLYGSRGKSDQIRHAVDNVSTDIIVINDADSILEASCIKELVSHLILNPKLAVVGATVEPDSTLLEERIHWRFLNLIWWLEGRALSAASICGVCYAFRHEKVIPSDQDVRAEDIHLALKASSRGHHVHICHKAHAIETRVPQTVAEFIKFRRRRGRSYISELLGTKNYRHAPYAFQLGHLMRLWHYFIVPKIGIGIALLSLALLFSPYRIWLIPSFIGLAAPALILILASSIASGEKFRWFKLCWASVRLFVLTSIALLALYSYPKKQGPVGERT